MEIEYSINKQVKYAYTFSGWEKKHIAKCLKKSLKSFDKQIEKIENNPDNEGQATYSCQIDTLRSQKKEIEEIIKEFDHE